MGYLVNKPKFVNYNTIIDANQVITCGSIPVELNSFQNGNFNGTWFMPIFASLQLINNTIPFDFNAGDHITIKDNNVNVAISILFYWNELLNNFNNNIPYSSLYTQKTNNFGGANIIGNYNPLKQNNLYLNTLNYNDCTQGDGQLKVTIGGYIINF